MYREGDDEHRECYLHLLFWPPNARRATLKNTRTRGDEPVWDTRCTAWTNFYIMCNTMTLNSAARELRGENGKQKRAPIGREFLWDTKQRNHIHIWCVDLTGQFPTPTRVTRVCVPPIWNISPRTCFSGNAVREVMVNKKSFYGPWLFAGHKTEESHPYMVRRLQSTIVNSDSH